MTDRSRFAPSPTGPAHPGTLLAALLCWLDARSRGAELLLRLEDVDHTRCTPARARDMCEALEWLGIDWDGFALQSERRARHVEALRALAAQGRVYACRCSRSELRRAALPAADGGWRYPDTCRERRVSPDEVAHSSSSLRFLLAPGRIELSDESGMSLAQDPHAEMGDPVLRRGDGAIAYHLAVVVDDADAGITRVVRGRDLATSTATQVALQRALGLPTPRYRHHLLLLEPRGAKLAKLHGAVGWDELRRHYSPASLCGWLACAAGLRPDAEAATPHDLLRDFDWSRVSPLDRVVRWEGCSLELLRQEGQGNST
jgi:glutamyl-tRNA synthetase/glutamyl-Q tRNA(Asp) synthetase